MSINDGAGEEQPSKHALVSGQESVFHWCMFVCQRVIDEEREGGTLHFLIHMY